MGRDLKVEFGRINQDNIEQVSTPTDVLYAELSCEEQTMVFYHLPPRCLNHTHFLLSSIHSTIIVCHIVIPAAKGKSGMFPGPIPRKIL